MTKVQYYVASTIDGFIADSHDKLDWLLQFGFEAYQEHYDAFMADVGALVMGARTYDFVLTEGGSWSYGRLPTWVLTHRELPGIPGADIRFTAEPVPEVHAELVAAAGEKNVWVVGGGEVAAQFADLGLIDELWLTVMPVVLGSGRPVLPVSSATPPLELLRTTHFDRGAVEHVYALRT